MVKNNEEASTSKEGIFEDSRFAHLVNDPRFKQLPKSERKVKIDKRFQGMFKDDKFKVKYTIDKYGRRLNKSSSEDLKKYYEIDSDESDAENEELEKQAEEKQIAKDEKESLSTVAVPEDETDRLLSEEDDDEEVPQDIVRKLTTAGIDYARGEGRLLTDSSSDDESSEDEGDADELFIDHVWGELDNDAPKTDESTRRLAACNMDWDRIRASDIMVLCNSFLPPGGSILRVSIYPSEYGKERMAEEELHGPPELTRDETVTKNNQVRSASEDSDSDQSNLEAEQDSDAEEGDDYHMEKLRQYQLNRLKYYYAVIECDSVATADKLYAECDGLEYESTATKLDFRFIPDETNFGDDEPKDFCTELPNLANYKPRLFTTTALQQAKVELTWDETNVDRKEISDKLSGGKIQEVSDADLRNYVAYSSEEDDEEENEDENEEKPAKAEPKKPIANDDQDIKLKNGSKNSAINKYKALLNEIEKKEDEKKKSKYDMELTWGINVSNKTKKEKSDIFEDQNVNPFEKILEKKHEKNQKRKQERKKRYKGNNDDSESSDDLPDGIDMNDPYFAEEFADDEFLPVKKSSKTTKKSVNIDSHNDESDEEKKQKELELLLDDDENDNREHFSLKKIQDAEKETKSKKKRRQKLKKSREEIKAAKNQIEDNFQVNVDDDRFKSVYTSHLFNIDPSDSHFKKTKGMEKIIEEKLKRRPVEMGAAGTSRNNDGDADEDINLAKRPKKQIENILLIKSLKRKLKGH